jgi:hypothetical protein
MVPGLVRLIPLLVILHSVVVTSCDLLDLFAGWFRLLYIHIREFTQRAFEMALHFVAETENIDPEDNEDEAERQT